MTTNTRKKKPARNAIAALHAAHWAMRPEALERLNEAAARTSMSEVMASEYANRMDEGEAPRVDIKNGVATIPVTGPLFRYANILTAYCGATAYSAIAQDVRAAIADPDVRAIVLDIDSPGGEVNGAGELADAIVAARGVKPIIAYISGDGCSAAYWIASAADEIVVAPCAIVGCIGTVCSFWDTSKAEEMAGYKRVEIVSSQTPKKRLDPTSDEGQAAIQELVDGLAAVFIEGLARNRGTSTDDVIANYGQGGVFVGEGSVSAGLAERIGTFDSLAAELSSGSYSPRPPRESASKSTNHQESIVKSTANIPSPAGSGEMPATEPVKSEEETKETCADCEHAPHEGKCTAEGCECTTSTEPAKEEPAPAEETEASMREHVAAAERARILGIQKLSRPGKEALIASCVGDPTCTIENAALRILESDRGVRDQVLTSLKGDESKLDKPGAITPAVVDGNSTGAAVQRITAAHEKATSPKRS